jgi:RNase P subunit RPR2
MTQSDMAAMANHKPLFKEIDMSSLALLALPPQMETADCPHCENPIPQQDISVTTGSRGLGGDKLQQVEAYCRICGFTHTMSRTFTGISWQRVGDITSVDTRAGNQAASDRKRKRHERQLAEQNALHAQRLAEDATDPGRDYTE